MSTAATEKQPSPDLPAASKPLSGHIRQLLLECPSRKAFFDQILKICFQQIPASVGYLEFQVGDKRQGQLTHDQRVERLAAEKLHESFLKPSLAEVWKQKIFQRPEIRQYQRGEKKFTVLTAAIPNSSNDTNDAVVSLLLAGNCDPKEIVPRIEGVTALAAAVMVSKTLSATQAAQSAPVSPQPQTHTGSPSTPSPPDSDGATALVANNALARAARFSSTKEFAYSIVNSLCSQLQAEQVSFGAVRHQKVYVEAVSNVPDFKANSPGVALARQAMEECFDNEKLILSQQLELNQIDPALPIHRQWSAENNGASILSIPLADHESTNAVISVQRSASRPFSAEEIEGITKMLEPYGPALPVVQKANRSVGQQLKSSASSQLKSAFGRRSIGRWVVMAGLVALALWFAFGTLLYRPICRTTVRASDLRYFAAPFAGKLEQVFVRPGEEVQSGQLLAQFETRDLQLSLNALVQEMGSSQVQMRQALEDDELPKAALARERINVLQAEAATIQQQIQRAKLVAPASGIVMMTDLDQRVGQVFPKGEELLQLAANGDWTLEIEVPDDLAGLVSSTQNGTFSAASFPTEKEPFQISTIDGSAQLVEDRNVFIARAQLQSRPEWIMNGMEGTARIETTRKPVWWVTLHRLVDWARLNYWL